MFQRIPHPSSQVASDTINGILYATTRPGLLIFTSRPSHVVEEIGVVHDIVDPNGASRLANLIPQIAGSTPRKAIRRHWQGSWTQSTTDRTAHSAAHNATADPDRKIFADTRRVGNPKAVTIPPQ